MGKKNRVIEEPIVQKMYIGPTIPRLGIMKNRLYRGTSAQIDAVFEKAKEAYPLIMQLVVVPDELVAKQDAMGIKGTPQNAAVRQILS